MREEGYLEEKEDDQKIKNLANEMRASILARYVIDRETWLHDLGGGGFMFIIFHT